ncbi:hypothetical protein DH2020_026467 [Rehmannia glutinosa]|uniref:Uncharacterized protein n=1 Tax=Rehmannia glutinosa TaxID=99300 RepID=A0ABR0VWU8_REHGL
MIVEVENQIEKECQSNDENDIANLKFNVEEVVEHLESQSIDDEEIHRSALLFLHPPARMSTTNSAAAAQPDPSSGSIDPIFHLVRILPFSFLRPPRLRLKLPSFTLPSPMTVYSLILLTYFMVVSGIVYDVIVEPPGIGSTQDRFTGSVRPVVFLPGRVNGQYIIEGLSSGFMFVLGGVGIVLLDLALDKNRAKSVKVSYASAGVAFIVISYVMSMLFIRIKIPGYLR